MSHNVLKMNYELISPYPQLVAEFERAYRENLCNFNFTEFVQSGAKLKEDAYTCALQQASQATAALSRTLYNDSNDIKFIEIAVQLWNPLTQQVISTPPSTPVHQTTTVTTRSRQDHHDKSATKDRQMQNLRRALEARLRVSRPFYPAICTLIDCRECKEQFMHAPVSPCRMHKCSTNCIPLGWYPHLPPKILADKRAEHAAGTMAQNIWKPRPLPFQKENPLYPSDVAPASPKTPDVLYTPSSPTYSIMAPVQDTVAQEELSWSAEVEASVRPLEQRESCKRRKY